MEIEDLEREPARYAYLRHIGPYPEIGATFGKMAQIAGAAGILGRPGVEFVGVYHNDPSTTAPQDLSSDAGVTLPDGAAAPEGLEEGTLPGGRYLKGVHRGSYAKMGESWMAFWDAVQASGVQRRAGSPFERYVSDMETTPEDDLVTELYVPVE